MIPVTKPYLPKLAEYTKYIEGSFQRGHLTNNGPLVKELTDRLESYLGVENLLLVANGTLALQIAYRTIGLNKSAVTTPFTFVATSSALKWEGINPDFCDINPRSLNLDVTEVARSIGKDSTGIVPVHVYGNPCDVQLIESLAREKNLKVVYDAAHAFGIRLNGKSILSFGDASTLSFHATKVFQTVEGGAIVFKKKEDLVKAKQLINFGIDAATGEIGEYGINAKMSEVHAAMGLAVLESINEIIERRCRLVDLYYQKLRDHVEIPLWNKEATENGAYVPILLKSRESRDKVVSALHAKSIFPRTYFAPALHKISGYPTRNKCPIAESAGERVLCLPIYFDLEKSDVENIASVVLKAIE